MSFLSFVGKSILEKSRDLGQSPFWGGGDVDFPSLFVNNFFVLWLSAFVYVAAECLDCFVSMVI